ncbi:hypothetical protein O3P69_011645 [Scylla paramamosain]|uniref:Uncharacterized protein n=1 Tax=Scylla paramamosain TaxID=85552 RepID=A0AAW0T7H8_SCYPA
MSRKLRRHHHYHHHHQRRRRRRRRRHDQPLPGTLNISSLTSMTREVLDPNFGAYDYCPDCVNWQTRHSSLLTAIHRPVPFLPFPPGRSRLLSKLVNATNFKQRDG